MSDSMLRLAPLDLRCVRGVIPSDQVSAATIALDSLRDISSRFGNPDLFHRPRWRYKLKKAVVREISDAQLSAALQRAAEKRTAIAWLAAESARQEAGARPTFDESSVLEIYRQLAEHDPNFKVREGFRTSNVKVGWEDGITIFIDVSPDHVRDELARLRDWYAHANVSDLDAVAIAYLQFLRVHPFSDGNGRIARLFAQCHLIALGLLNGLQLDLEAWVETNRQIHDKTLAAATTEDAFEWGALFARAIVECANYQVHLMRRYLVTLHQLQEHDASAAILAGFLEAPVITAACTSKHLGTSLAESAGVLEVLRRNGILSAHPEIPGGFFQTDLLAILDTAYR
jgi:Fic family protein